MAKVIMLVMNVMKHSVQNGINDIIGENFDIKAIQILLLHFVDKLWVEPSGDKVRDIVGFEAYEGYEVEEEIVDGASIIESTKTENETLILSSSSSDASATAVDTEDDFLVTNDDTNHDHIPAVPNDVSFVDDKEGKSINMEALNNGVVEKDVIM